MTTKMTKMKFGKFIYLYLFYFNCFGIHIVGINNKIENKTKRRFEDEETNASLARVDDRCVGFGSSRKYGECKC